MATTKQGTKRAGRTKRTLHIDDDKLARAAVVLGTDSTTKIVDEALRRLVVGKPRMPLGTSELPPVAERLDEAMVEAGFGL